MDYDRIHIVHVLDDKMRVIGVFTEKEIIDAIISSEAGSTFEEFMQQNQNEINNKNDNIKGNCCFETEMG